MPEQCLSELLEKGIEVMERRGLRHTVVNTIELHYVGNTDQLEVYGACAIGAMLLAIKPDLNSSMSMADAINEIEAVCPAIRQEFDTQETFEDLGGEIHNQPVYVYVYKLNDGQFMGFEPFTLQESLKWLKDHGF